MHRIMVIEDDQSIARSIEKHLQKWGYDVLVATDFKDVLSAYGAFSPHLVLLDVALPFFSGYHWCSEIRKISKVPILFISSASDDMNIVMAINMGGDDFVAKPFDLSVLTAKIQALLRRAYDFSGEAELLEHRGAILNKSDATLSYQGQKVQLTKNEFRILELLMERKGEIVGRDELIERLWETDDYIDDNTLSVNVARLRKKMEEHELCDFILTRKGIGYLVE